jgi:hypothetical protein
VGRYIFSVADGVRGRERALSEGSRRKRREAWRLVREMEREAVRRLWRRGMVPLAISDELGLPDRTTVRYLRELERAGEIDPVPSYLSLVWRGLGDA